MPSSRSRPTRRQVLAASVAVPAAWLTGACTLSRTDGASAPERPEPAEDPDVVLLAHAVVLVEDLIALLERVVAERPPLATEVEPLLANHRRHAEVLGSAATPDSTRTPEDAADGPAGDEGRPLPRRRNRVLGLVARREQRAADAHLRQVQGASSGQFARLLASVSAAESQHAAVLEEALR